MARNSEQGTPSEIMAGLYDKSPIRWGSDETTADILRSVGVTEGWRCLEIGAGVGSIADWFCRRVGPTGSVVATEVNTRFLSALKLKHPNLEVLEHSIVDDDLPESDFGVVHTRLVLLLFPERNDALHKMAKAVKPGGWIVVEEPDFITDSAEPFIEEASRDLYNKVSKAVQAVQLERGMGLYFGSEIYGLLRSFGFESLRSEAHARIVNGGGSEAVFFKRIAMQFRDQVLESGKVTETELEDFGALFEDPSFAWRTPLTISTWGRRPEA